MNVNRILLFKKKKNDCGHKIICTAKFKVNRYPEPHQTILGPSVLEAHKCVVVKEGFRLDVRIVSFYQACFHPPLRQKLTIEVRLLSLCYNISLCCQNNSGRVVTGKIQTLRIATV